MTLQHAVHTAHAAHTTHAAHTSACCFVVSGFAHHAVGGQHQAGDRRCVLQCRTGDLGWIQHAHFDHVAVGAVGGVIAVVAFACQNGCDDDRSFFAGVLHDHAQWLFHRAQHDLDAGVLVWVVAFDGDVGARAQQGYAAAWHDAFFHGSAGSVQCIFNAGFLFFHFDFGGSANLDHGNAAGQLGHALLQIFTVVVRAGFFDLHAHLLDARFDRFGLAGAVDDDGVFLADFDTLGLAQFGQGDFFQGQADFFSDHLAAGQDSDVFQHGFATVAEARRFDGAGFQDAADVVDHQGRQRFAFDVFGDDQQRTASFCDLFQYRQQVTDVGDFLVAQQDEWIVQDGDLLLLVVDEVWRQVAAVKLHTFNDVQLVVQRFAVFDGDDAFLADFFHRFSDTLADRVVGVGRDRADLGDFFGGGAWTSDFRQLFDGGSDCLVDAALQVHRVHAGGHELHAFAHDGLGQHGGGGGAVAGVVAGAGSNFLDHLRAHVLQLVFQFDFFRNRHTILGDGRGAERALQHHVAAFRAQRDFNCVGEDVDALTILARAASPKITSLAAMLFLLNSVDKCTNGCQLLDDDRHDVFFAHDHQFLAVHFDGLAGVFAEQDAVAYFDIQRTDFAVVEDFAIADGQDFALIRFFGGCVRNDQAGGSFGFLVEAFDDDAIVQRAKVHKNSLFNGGGAKAMTAPAYRPRLQTSCRCNQFATASKSC